MGGIQVDLQQLAYFRTVARLGNMTKAAAELHIAQPSLSVSIARLESELGVKLFDRVSGRIRLNHVGQCFFRQTDRIFLAVQDAMREVADFSDRAPRTVRIAVTASGLCTELLARFMREHRDFQIHQFLHTETNARALLEEGQVDFVIAASTLASPLIVWQTLLEERLVALLSLDNPLAGAPLLRLDQLREQRFVMMKSAFHPDGEYAEFFSEWLPQAEVSFVTNEFEVMVAMVELDIGIAVVSEETASNLLLNPQRNLAAVPIDTDYRGRRIGVARLKGHYFTRAVQAFFDYTVQYFQMKRTAPESPAGAGI